MAISVDVAKLVRHSFGEAKLESRMVSNKGVSSKSLLSSLIGTVPGVSTTSVSVNGDTITHILNFLNRFGPALVNRFETDNYFRENQYTVPPHQEDEPFMHQFDRDNEENFHVFVSLGTVTAML